MALNLQLFIKVMGMTGSDADGEALTAIRRANKMLEDAGERWDTLLAKKSGPPPNPNFARGPSPGRGFPSAAARQWFHMSQAQAQQNAARAQQVKDDFNRWDERQNQAREAFRLIEMLSEYASTTEMEWVAIFKAHMAAKGEITNRQAEVLAEILENVTERARE